MENYFLKFKVIGTLGEPGELKKIRLRYYRGLSISHTQEVDEEIKARIKIAGSHFY